MNPGVPTPVVVDVETTGFGRSDKIVEIAAITLDSATWETIGEYDTLINPERDVGPTGVHGITASMVAYSLESYQSIPFKSTTRSTAKLPRGRRPTSDPSERRDAGADVMAEL